MTKLMGWLLALGLVSALILAPGADVSGAQEESETFRAMTYNIQHGAGNDDCEDPEVPEGEVPPTECAVDLERTAETIEAQSPNIVAVQEVDRFWARSGEADQAAELAEMTGMEQCYGANLTREPGESGTQEHYYGTLILSEYPILSCDNTHLPTPEDWEQRGLLEAHVDVPGVGEVAVLNTHMQFRSPDEPEEAVRQRTEQAEAIATRIAELEVPVILMGDLNAQVGDEELDSLFDANLGLQDAWAIAADDGTEGYTYAAHPVDEPDERIDFVLPSAEFTVEYAEVVVDDQTRMASDHYPVVADLATNGLATPVATPEEALPEATPID